MPLIVGELAAILDLDANPFTRNLNRAMTDGERTGARMSKVGDTISAGLTVPLVAAGGMAVKLGTDFDTAFSRMVGLAGVPANEVDQLKESVLGLAGETAVAPQELADALYFAASAGLDAAGAMDAVTYAAKASAAGMGSAQEIVGLAASAVASYGQENIDAARATDILTAAVRAGRADPEELASTLGRVLPIASQLGISFEEVGGAVAYLSNVFGDTNRTVTSLSGLMVKLVSPTQGGREALEEMGTSVEELQGAIDERGLMGALELLREKGFASNQQALRALFDDIEGYQGALALLNDESGSLAGTLEEVAGSAGALDEAFNAASGTDGFKMKQALADLQVAAIEAGDVIAPFVATVVGGVSDIIGVFSQLPGPAQQVILAFAGILMASGPLLSIGGRLVSNWKSIASGLENLATKAVNTKSAVGSIGQGGTTAAGGLGRMGKAMGALGIVGAVAGLAAYANSLNKVSVNVDEAAAALANLSDEEATQVRLGILAAERFGDLDEMVRQLADGNMIAAERFVEQAEAAGIAGDRLEELKGILDSKRESDVQGAKDQEQYSAEVQAAAGATAELSGEMEDAATSAETLATAYIGLLEATLDLFNSDVAYRRSLDKTEDAVQRLVDVQGDAESTAEDVARATLDAEDAMLRQAEAAVRYAEDQAVANGAALTAQDKARLYKEELYRLAGTLKPGSALHQALVGHMETLNAIPEQVSTRLLVDAGGAFKTVREFLGYLDQIGAKSPTGFTALLEFKQDQLLKAHSGGTVPGPSGKEVGMLLLGGETVRTEDQERALQHQMSGGTIYVEIPVVLDGRRIGSSTAVIQGMDARRAVRDRNTGAR